MTPADQKQLLRESEAKVHSQFGEDGILQLIFSRIGAVDRRFVEFGIGNGKECNTANLSIHQSIIGEKARIETKTHENKRFILGDNTSLEI